MNTKHNTYTANDFAKYHSGTMPASEMYALEKAALEDPFLADALDGYALSTNSNIEITSIKERLNKKTANSRNVKPIIKFPWLRIAAAAVVFIGLGYLFVQVNKKTSDSNLAQNKTKIEVASDTISKDSTKIESNNTTSNEIATTNKKPSNTTSELTTTTLPSNELELPTPTTTQTPTPYTPQLTEAVTVNPATNYYPIQNNPSVFNNNTNNKIASGPKQLAQNNNIGNQTINNKPNFDNALLKEKNIAANDTLFSKDLAFNESKKRSNIIVKESDNKAKESTAKLEEIAVSGYESKRLDAKAKSTSRVVDGRVAGITTTNNNEFKNEATAFYTYVKQNIKPVFDTKGNEIKGTVKLSFKTNKKGRPIKIEIIQSVNNDCNSQAISLLKNGPTWDSKITDRKQVEIIF